MTGVSVEWLILPPQTGEFNLKFRCRSISRRNRNKLCMVHTNITSNFEEHV